MNCDCRNIDSTEAEESRKDSSSSSSSSQKTKEYFEEIVKIETITTNDGRIIEYGTIIGKGKGDNNNNDNNNNATPIVFFPPLECTARMLICLQDALDKHSSSSFFKVVSVNRPGVDRTSWAAVHHRKGDKSGSAAKIHLDQACEDVATVLDALQWWNNNDEYDDENTPMMVGVFSMCAGTPFAMAFCSKYPTKTTNLLIAAPWVLCADCPHSKFLYKFAAHYLPISPISYVVGSISSFFMNYVVSKETVAKKLYSSLSETEQQGWNKRFFHNNDNDNDNHNDNNDNDNNKKSIGAAETLDWVLGDAAGNKLDIAVCLASSQELGIDYSKVIMRPTTTATGDTTQQQQQQRQQHKVEIWIGDKDHMTSVESAKWLADQLGSSVGSNNDKNGKVDTSTASSSSSSSSSSSDVAVHVLPNGTHHGALFMLDKSLVDSLQFLLRKPGSGGAGGS